MTSPSSKPNSIRREQTSLKRAGERLLYALAGLVGFTALLLVWAGPEGHRLAPLTAATAVVVVVALVGGLLWAAGVRWQRRIGGTGAGR